MNKQILKTHPKFQKLYKIAEVLSTPFIIPKNGIIQKNNTSIFLKKNFETLYLKSLEVNRKVNRGIKEIVKREERRIEKIGFEIGIPSIE